MSAIDDPAEVAPAMELVEVLPETLLVRFEALLGKASERLNPILIKEARQALRSKQFILTFMLMLAAGWAWSIFGLANIGPAVYYSAAGPSMFSGYFAVLAFPLLVVAPYSAFYSLSCERQDRTYELVSITALNARQILSGKLSSVVLQMMVYLSAIFPCLAFTYLLRGLDIFTVFIVVVYTCLLSLGLSIFGLLLASLTPLRQRQIVMTVLLLLMLFVAFILDCMITFSIVADGNMMVNEAEFWQVNLVLLTIYLNFCAIAFLSARSLLMTDSQNRSTALRVALLVAQLSLVGWASWGYLMAGRPALYLSLVASIIFWYVAGTFLTGEPPVLSPRVKRDLPQTTLGRVFFTWFTPGPGTGFMFVVVNVLAASLMAVLPTVARDWLTVPRLTPNQLLNVSEFLQTAVIAASYLIIYLGLEKLILNFLRRYSEIRLLTRVLIQVLLLVVGSGVPWALQMTLPSLRDDHYTLLQITNPLWTVLALCNKGLPFHLPVLILAVPSAALLVWMLNLPSLLTELEQVRVAKPPRVADDDAEQAAPVHAGPTSPWDE